MNKNLRNALCLAVLIAALPGSLLTLSPVAHAGPQKAHSAAKPKQPRKPVKIVLLSQSAQVYNGPAQWGHDTLYNFEIRDNSNNAYGLGQAREAFSNILPAGFQPNGPGGPSTWPKGADFTDDIGYKQNTGVGYNPATFRCSFDQSWSCVVNGTAIALTTKHHLNKLYGSDTRTVLHN